VRRLGVTSSLGVAVNALLASGGKALATEAVVET
jgi:hypothetical protein